MKKKVYKVQVNVTFRVSLANTWLALIALILAAFSSDIRQQYLTTWRGTAPCSESPSILYVLSGYLAIFSPK
ncbi:hypothetical protein FOM00_26300 [Pseudomonas sp. ST1]|uniref:Uncharacterized protein n=1 Tax=Pseudomonas savastanoi pv. nerii TaxID=360921 RepID=A0AB74B996_PSESS|nr:MULTISPECIES: hypothetical protein [Pseudomonas]KAA3533806.1 hypothetical protein DXU85_26495 [Pseudomonas savastanoi]RML68129.1 hypothetical protein ALQ90_200056 [Pseudomonas savastanoi pv. savastanoi]RMT67299.1 hypothetical protein ALP42_00703 [Pseudomonas savastanoi pv. nerii]TSC32500.1 hypothetical protein FOM00_26300 [Pseudomonas sp. ST1]UKL10606.1 hypothetical protein HQ966_03850 [Pseudomonas savastanoi pv. savastanoi]